VHVPVSGQSSVPSSSVTRSAGPLGNKSFPSWCDWMMGAHQRSLWDLHHELGPGRSEELVVHRKWLIN